MTKRCDNACRMKEYETEMRLLRTALYDAACDLNEAADALRHYDDTYAEGEAQRATEAAHIARNAANRSVR